MSYGTTGSGAATHVDDAPRSSAGSRASPNDAHNGGEATPLLGAVHDRNGQQSTTDDQSLYAVTSFWHGVRGFYERNIGLLFVFVAQIFASIMAMTTRLLETGFETKFHALQIIFVRMLATAVIGFAWMWYKSVPDMPWGPRGVRRLLVIRGTAGSIGLFGLYYSLSYLDVSDATVITFLVPTITTFVCWVALNEPFTVNEASAGLIALAGVVFIARPGFLFSDPDGTLPDDDDDDNAESLGGDMMASMGLDVVSAGGILPPVRATPLERSIAVACALMGAFSAATAYATIRVIGKRAHSLVSVNYFAMLASLSSFLIIMIHPGLRFEIPRSPIQWILLVVIGLSGFLLQILLTEGLQREKAGRATNLIYTQLLFSLIIDYLVWGSTPSLSSIFGGVLIICAAVWVSLQKNSNPEKKEEGDSRPDEERSLLRSEENDNTSTNSTS